MTPSRQRGAVKVAPHFSLTPEVNAMVDALAAWASEEEGLGTKPDRSREVALAVRARYAARVEERAAAPKGGPGMVAARKGRGR